MDVVEQHHERAVGGSAEVGRDRLVQREPHGAAGCRRAEGRRAPTRPATAGDSWATGRARVADERLELLVAEACRHAVDDLGPRPERGCPGRGGGPPGVHGDVRRRAISSSVSSSVVLPMPGSPANSTSEPVPLVVSLSRAACSTPSSRSRPTSIRVEPPAAGAGGAVSVDAAAGFEGCGDGRGNGLGRGGRWVEVGILRQDPLEQGVHAARGEDAELVVEHDPKPAVDLQRVGRPPASVQREHEQRLRFFTQGVVGGEAVECREGVGVASGGEHRLEPALHRRQVGLRQLRDDALGELVVGHLGQRISGPESDRLVQRRERLDHRTLSEEVAARLGEGPQPHRVDRLGRQVDEVPGAAGDEGGPERTRRAQRLPEVRDVRPQRHGALRRWCAVPELVDQALGADHPADVEEQQDQEGALAARGDLDRVPVHP